MSGALNSPITNNQLWGYSEYCGDVINFKTYSKSYKDKTRHENAPEDWTVFEGVHEPVVERSLWQMIQDKRGGKRKRKKKGWRDKHILRPFSLRRLRP